MGKWKHRLTEVNKTDKTATCAHCGENTSIRVWASTGKVACRTRVNEAKSRETRVRTSSPESKERRNASRHGLTYVQYKEMLDKGFLASTNFYASTTHSDADLESYFNALDEVYTLIARCEKGDLKIENLLNGPVCHGGFKRLN